MSDEPVRSGTVVKLQVLAAGGIDEDPVVLNLQGYSNQFAYLAKVQANDMILFVVSPAGRSGTGDLFFSIKSIAYCCAYDEIEMPPIHCNIICTVEDKISRNLKCKFFHLTLMIPLAHSIGMIAN